MMVWQRDKVHFTEDEPEAFWRAEAHIRDTGEFKRLQVMWLMALGKRGDDPEVGRMWFRQPALMSYEVPTRQVGQAEKLLSNRRSQ